ncbi:unnamed protein product [marine sediment metagenome]|uniref:Uncharacterized protein n=1 Tax=marine sediment metagenome TaxID=412755 RepID=X1D1M2_9ZZZZ
MNNNRAKNCNGDNMKIYVVKDIKSDFPFSDAGKVKIGIHEAIMNKHGAISCKSDKNELIGIKLDEFKFISHRDREEWIKIAYPKIPKIITMDNK